MLLCCQNQYKIWFQSISLYINIILILLFLYAVLLKITFAEILLNWKKILQTYEKLHRGWKALFLCCPDNQYLDASKPCREISTATTTFLHRRRHCHWCQVICSHWMTVASVLSKPQWFHYVKSSASAHSSILEATCKWFCGTGCH